MALEFITLILKLLFLIFLILLPFLYDLNAKFRYYVKFFVFKTLITCVSAILIPLAICKPLQITNISIATKFSNFISKVLNIRWNVAGVENLKLNEPCILLANYQSPLDVLGVLQICPHLETTCTVTTTTDILRTGPFGLAAWLSGVIFVDRAELADSKCLMSSKIKQLKHDNVSILVFPEDERYHDGEIHEFQRSPFYLAIKEQLPIVPVVFSNYYFVDEQHKIFDPGHITIEALPPINTEKLSTDDVSMLIQETRNTMINTLRRLSSKLTPPSVEELRKNYKC